MEIPIYSSSFFFLLGGYTLFAILLGITAGAIMLPAIKAFPISARFSGCCIAFNLSMSLFGETALSLLYTFPT